MRYKEAVIKIGSSEWRRKTFSLAIGDDADTFTALTPEETGLNRSIYISGWKKCPAFIVDSEIGNKVEPSPGSKVYVIGELTGDVEVDKWLTMNKDIITDYQGQKIGASSLDAILKAHPHL